MPDQKMSAAFIYDGGRSAFGRHPGSLASVRPDNLLAHVIKTVVERNPFAATAYEDVIIGNTNGAGEDCRNVARFAGLLAGMDTAVGGLTVNRLGGSGLAATLDAARAVKVGEGELVITKPLPMMPLGFLGDPDRSRLRDTYFNQYPGKTTWYHADHSEFLATIK